VILIVSTQYESTQYEETPGQAVAPVSGTGALLGEGSPAGYRRDRPGAVAAVVTRWVPQLADPARQQFVTELAAATDHRGTRIGEHAAGNRGFRRLT